MELGVARVWVGRVLGGDEFLNAAASDARLTLGDELRRDRTSILIRVVSDRLHLCFFDPNTVQVSADDGLGRDSGERVNCLHLRRQLVLRPIPIREIVRRSILLHDPLEPRLGRALLGAAGRGDGLRRDPLRLTDDGLDSLSDFGGRIQLLELGEFLWSKTTLAGREDALEVLRGRGVGDQRDGYAGPVRDEIWVGPVADRISSGR